MNTISVKIKMVSNGYIITGHNLHGDIIIGGWREYQTKRKDAFATRRRRGRLLLAVGVGLGMATLGIVGQWAWLKGEDLSMSKPTDTTMGEALKGIVYGVVLDHPADRLDAVDAVEAACKADENCMDVFLVDQLADRLERKGAKK